MSDDNGTRAASRYATTVNEAGKPAKSVHAACVDAGLRKTIKIDRDVNRGTAP